MHSQAWMTASAAPAAIPARTPTGVGTLSAATAAAKAPTRIIPSIPTFTTPDRSDSTAPSAAKISAGANSSVEKRSASTSSSTRHLRGGGGGGGAAAFLPAQGELPDEPP